MALVAGVARFMDGDAETVRRGRTCSRPQGGEGQSWDGSPRQHTAEPELRDIWLDGRKRRDMMRRKRERETFSRIAK